MCSLLPLRHPATDSFPVVVFSRMDTPEAEEDLQKLSYEAQQLAESTRFILSWLILHGFSTLDTWCILLFYFCEYKEYFWTNANESSRWLSLRYIGIAFCIRLRCYTISERNLLLRRNERNQSEIFCMARIKRRVSYFRCHFGVFHYSSILKHVVFMSFAVIALNILIKIFCCI